MASEEFHTEAAEGQRDRRFHGGEPAHLDDEELERRTEASRVEAGLDVASPAVQAGIYTVALVPNVLGYGLLAARAARGPAGRSAGTVVSAGVEATLPAQPDAPLRGAGLSRRSAPAGSPRCAPRARARRC